MRTDKIRLSDWCASTHMVQRNNYFQEILLLWKNFVHMLNCISRQGKKRKSFETKSELRFKQTHNIMRNSVIPYDGLRKTA